jgi:spoIIIJ-associated protein
MTDYSKIEIVQNLLTEILRQAGFDGAKINYEESITKGLVFNIDAGPDSYMLIGRQGSTLHSLQVLLGHMAERKLKEPFWFTLDVDDYKMKREWFLKETAKAAVDHIKKTGRAAALEEMPSFERRFIHAYIQQTFPEVESMSIGLDPHRKVVIRLKR